jgi:hypothetical protein
MFNVPLCFLQADDQNQRAGQNGYEGGCDYGDG